MRRARRPSPEPRRLPEHRSTLAPGAALAVGLLASACASSQTTERVFDGHSVVGPYIQPSAYAAYAEGVYLEEQGNAPEALRAYRRAQASDSDSPAITTRIGALLCRTDRDAGLDELDTSDVARDYAPAWAARARCLHGSGDRAGALEAARRAVRLDARSAEGNLLVARIHREQAQPEKARAWLLGWVLSDPGAGSYWKAIDEEGRLAGDVSIGELARSARGRDPADPSDAGDTGDAAASGERPTPSAPSTSTATSKQLAHGEPEVALREALLAFDANPRNADAFVEASYAALLVSDDALLEKLLRQARVNGAPRAELAPSMVELIRIVVGDDAAERWSSAYQRVTAPRP